MSRSNFPSFNAVQKAIGKKFNHELMAISAPGSSGSRVFILKDFEKGKLYAVKAVKISRVSLLEERKKRDFLSKHLPCHIPDVIDVLRYEECEIMISSCPGIDTLHSLILNSNKPHAFLEDVWISATDSLADLWVKTAEPFRKDDCQRRHDERIERIREGVQNIRINSVSLKDHMDAPIIFNNQICPSLNEILKEIKDITEPEIGVVCHGDPQPSNIVVNDEKNWFLIDWEWSGRQHDWRMMLSHMHGWWTTHYSSIGDTPKTSIDVEGNLVINIENIYCPYFVRQYQRQATKIYTRLLEKRIATSQDTQDINRFLATLHLGDARFAPIWRKEVLIPLFIAVAASICRDIKVGNNNKSPYGFPCLSGNDDL